MRVWTKISIYMGILLLFVCITACGKTDSTQLENDATAESQNDATAESQNDTTAEPQAEEIPVQTEESEDITQPQQKYTYRGDAVLTEDNINTTMKSFLQISDSAFLAGLETLPLTEKFFNECIEHPENFPYVDEDDLRQTKEFKLVFWGIREDGKCVCFCEFRGKNAMNPKTSCYYIVMDLENEQIDSMEVTLVKKNSNV